ncbi:MAG: DUF3791 domain-containing protein [Lactobacillaceae bacterium]|jgi:hypothetical protein|nr:DUF3791 domain-containing protein [Lactobacillaceae bacterium]
MSKETDFFIYLLEGYAESKGESSRDVLNEWQKRDLIDKIYDMYDLYHIERLENAYEDIDKLINEDLDK